MTHTLTRSLVVLFLLCLLAPTSLEARGPARAVAKRATERLLATASVRNRSLLLRDTVRDARSQVLRLVRPRSVFRYTSARTAALEFRGGVAARRHFTSRISAGRPLSSLRAQRRFGLPRSPQARLTIRLPKGTPVRLNKALGGEPGWGEITSTRRLPPGAVRKVVPLRPSK